MHNALKLVTLGRACRNTAGIKNRQPLGKMYAIADFRLSEEYIQLVKEELNVKELVFTDDLNQFTAYKFKPQLKTVGPKYGKLAPKISQALADLDGHAAVKRLEEGLPIELDIDGACVRLTEQDLLIETAQKEGFVSESGHGITVVLDANLTPELLEEGFVREIISKLQTTRKESGFEVLDRIRVFYGGSPVVADIMKRNGELISSEVLADELIELKEGMNISDLETSLKEWKINGEKTVLAVEKV